MSAEKIILQRSVSQKRVDFIRNGGQRHFSAQGTAKHSSVLPIFRFYCVYQTNFFILCLFFPAHKFDPKNRYCLHRSFLSFSDSRTLFSAATGLYRKNLPLSAVSQINRRGQRRRKRNQNSIYVFLPKKGAFRSAASLRSEYLPHKPVACRYLAVTFGKSYFHFKKFFLSDPVLTDQAQKNF